MSLSIEAHKGRSPFMASVIAIVPIVVAAVLGNMATLPNIPWYDGLAKPPLTPPNWLFGPAWTTLYTLMAYAFYRVLRRDASEPGRTLAIALFFIQLVFNAGWSFAFFGAQSPTLGLAVILPMEALIFATIYAFWRLDRIAAALLIPYAIWVAFATYLNGGVWMLN